VKLAGAEMDLLIPQRPSGPALVVSSLEPEKE
jgi:hypothetical protein